MAAMRLWGLPIANGHRFWFTIGIAFQRKFRIDKLNDISNFRATCPISELSRCLLQLHPLVENCLESMSVGDLARLVYRDHITVKHASRKRLHEEVDEKMKHLDACQQKLNPEYLSVLGPGERKVDPLSKLLVEYLLEAVLFRGMCERKGRGREGEVFKLQS